MGILDSLFGGQIGGSPNDPWTLAAVQNLLGLTSDRGTFTPGFTALNVPKNYGVDANNPNLPQLVPQMQPPPRPA